MEMNRNTSGFKMISGQADKSSSRVGVMIGARAAGALALAVGVGLAGTAMGAATTWSGGNGTSWATDGSGGNWGGSAAPGNTSGTLTSTSDSATFSAGSNLQVDPDSGRRIAGLTFDSTAGNYIIGPSTGATTLYMQGNIKGNNTSTITFNSPIQTVSDMGINPAANQTYNFNGAFRGRNGLSVYMARGTNSVANFYGGLASDSASGVGYFWNWSSGFTANVLAPTSLGKVNIYGVTGTLNLGASNILVSPANSQVRLEITTGKATFNAANAMSGSAYIQAGDVTSGTASVTINHDQDYGGRQTDSAANAGKGRGTILGNVSYSTTINQAVNGAPDIGVNGFTSATTASGSATLLVNNNVANTGVGASHTAGGSATGNSDVNVVTGLLGGNGYIVNTDVTVSGTPFAQGVTLHRRLNTSNSTVTYGKLSPGASAGVVGTLTMDLGSKGLNISAPVSDTNSQALLFDLIDPGNSDKVNLLNNTTLHIGTGGLEWDDFTFTTTGSIPAGTYTLFSSATNAIDGTLGANVSGVLDGHNFHLDFANGGKDLILTTVPEPATLGLLAIGGLGLLARRRRV